MMKVAIIEPVGGHGGMDYYDYGLAYGLGSNDACVYYYTCDETNVRNFPNVFTIISFKKLWYSNFICKVFRYIKGHLVSFEDVRKKGIKIVHLHFFTFRVIDCLVLIMARVMNLTTIVTVHDINAFDKRANRIVEKWSYRLIDGVIVHNQASFVDLKKKCMPVKKTAIIPHGNYKPFIRQLSEKDKTKIFTLLFFGQIKEVKGLGILLKAIKLIVNKGFSDIELIIAGKAWKSDLNYYQNLIDELGIQNYVKADFRYIPDEEVSSIYSKADLVVLPYTEIYQSGVLLLTMSYGKPVLSSGLKAFREIVVDGKTGFIFENKNEVDLAKKIINIMNHPEILKEVANNAISVMDTHYNWINIGKKTLDFYKSVAK